MVDFASEAQCVRLDEAAGGDWEFRLPVSLSGNVIFQTSDERMRIWHVRIGQIIQDLKECGVPEANRFDQIRDGNGKVTWTVGGACHFSLVKGLLDEVTTDTHTQFIS